jgi:hypothetical protein
MGEASSVVCAPKHHPDWRLTVSKKHNSGDEKRFEQIPAEGSPGAGSPNDQDVKRRLGNFTTAGEHARQGGRTTGIVGQTKQKNSTDKKG